MFFKKQDDDLFISKKDLKDYNKKYSEPYDSVKNDGENKNILSYNYVIYSCITNASKKEVCNTELKSS